MISPEHLTALAGSGITPDFAIARGYETITDTGRLADIKITAAGRNVPGLLVPQLRVDGSTWGYQYRPDRPRLRQGKLVKYETPHEQRNGLDIPPGVAPMLADPNVPLWITEGVKKADCGAINGLCIVALSGVWNWITTSTAGGKMALPEWRDVALNGRRVVMAFDGDLARKESVQKAARGLSSYLATKGARIEWLWLPDTDEKTGLDDYLAEHDVAELLALVKPTSPPVSQKPDKPDDNGKSADNARTRVNGESSNTASVATRVDKRGFSFIGSRHTKDGVSGAPVAIANALATFGKWLHMDDTAPVLAVAATIVTNLANGDPVWLLIVGPPSGGKTEILSSAAGLPYIVPAATITEAALLSGTSSKERASDATGGLLRQIGDFGIMLAKDFTSVLSQNRDTAKSAMAAMREIYDGSWDRPVGSDGGKVLHWAGKCGFIGGVTPSYDRYSSIVNALGDRYLLLRLPDVDADKQVTAALRSTEQEKAMRVELAAAMTGLIAGANRDLVYAPLTDDDITRLKDLAMFTARARTAVERDGYTGELLVMPQPEGPARLVKALRRVYGGMVAIGADDDTRWDLLRRIAVDCLPAMRTPLLRELLEHPEPRRTADIAAAVGMVTKTAHRTLDDLALLKIAVRTKQTSADNSPDLWSAGEWLHRFAWVLKVGQKSTTRREGEVKEGDLHTHNGDSVDTHSAPFRTFRSHSDGRPDPVPITSDPADDTANTAYRNGMCRDCHTQPQSAGRPRCADCHKSYLGVMAGYDN